MLTTRLYAWTRAHPMAVDTVIAVGLFLTFGLVSAAVGMGTYAVVFAFLETALLAVRRRWPVTVMVVMVALSLLQVAVVPTLIPANVAQLYVIYTVAAHVASFRTRLVVLGFGFLGSLLGALRIGAYDRSLGTIAFTAFAISVSVVLVWVVGNIIRGRESIIEQLSESNAILRRDREQRDLIAAQGERARIAREMHDIVAHSLSVVVVQADGGAYAAEHATRWERGDAQRTLTTIGGTARSALAETRRLVGVLRDETSSADLAPLAGLADLDTLLDRVRSSGLTVTAQTLAPGALGGLTRDVDLAAYRVVQEALTNVLKHAGPGAAAHVVLERTPDALRVVVSDDGLGASAGDDGEGNGIVGMRERVTASGGRLLVGPRPAGGFAVTATLPAPALAPGGPPSPPSPVTQVVPLRTPAPTSPAPADETRVVPTPATQPVPAHASGPTEVVPVQATRPVRTTPTSAFWSGGAR